MKDRKEIDTFLDNIQFLSPNEPITQEGILRVLNQMSWATSDLEDALDGKGKQITMWNPNITYGKDDVVLYFKEENKQVAPDIGKRKFAFILVSIKEDNSSIPNYDLVDGLPDFTTTNWMLLNPTSYLLQDLEGMRKLVKELFQALLDRHVKEEHGLVVSGSIENDLLRKDYSNLNSKWELGNYTVVKSKSTITSNSHSTASANVRLLSNGVLEQDWTYGFDAKANQMLKISDARYYYSKSPIWDESDHSIFSQKFMEDDMFSVLVNGDVNFNNLRLGTNVFTANIAFPSGYGFVDDEYMVFFDSYSPGQFVFGYDKEDLEAQEEPTYDAIVSRPMMMNKTSGGFDIVLPVHTYFNSMQRYNVGVPWNNKFRFHVIGRAAR